MDTFNAWAGSVPNDYSDGAPRIEQHPRRASWMLKTCMGTIHAWNKSVDVRIDVPMAQRRIQWYAPHVLTHARRDNWDVGEQTREWASTGVNETGERLTEGLRKNIKCMERGGL